MSLISEIDQEDITTLEQLLNQSNRHSLVWLDGYFHGIATLPQPLMPSSWLPVILDKLNPAEGNAGQLFGLLITYYNHVLTTFRLQANAKPRQDDSIEQITVWLNGFYIALLQDVKSLKVLSAAIKKQDDTQPTWNSRLLALSLDLKAHKSISDDDAIVSNTKILQAEAIEAIEALAPPARQALLATYAHFVCDTLQSTDNSGKPALLGGGNSDKPYVRKQAKVGRNDPCPCGSGKKYKHCHGKAGAAPL
jgi:yecA family protein